MRWDDRTINNWGLELLQPGDSAMVDEDMQFNFGVAGSNVTGDTAGVRWTSPGGVVQTNVITRTADDCWRPLNVFAETFCPASV